MAYSWTNGMSVRAVEAYESGLVPASKIKAVPAKLIKIFCTAEEWHHTSARYNRTNFYDVDKVLATFGIIPEDESRELYRDDFAVKGLTDYRAGERFVDTRFDGRQQVR